MILLTVSGPRYVWYGVQLTANLREDFTITGKLPTRAPSYLKMPTSADTKALVGAFSMIVKSPLGFVESSRGEVGVSEPGSGSVWLEM